MHLIKSTTAVVAAPALPSFAAGVEGYFTQGNPGLGQAATVVEDWFLNMMMAEIYNAVVDQGLAASRSDWTQLSQAIQTAARRKYLGVSANTGATAAQQGTHFAVDTSGGNRTITLPEIDPAGGVGKVKPGAYFEVSKVTTDANAVAVAASGAQVVRGSVTGITTPWEAHCFLAVTQGGTHSWVQLHRSLRQPHVEYNGNATLTAAHNGMVVRVNSGGGAVAITLPDGVAAGGGFTVTVKKASNDANMVTVQRAGADTIDGATSVVLTKYRDAVTLVGTGTALYQVVGRYDPSPTPGAASESAQGIVELADGTEAAALSDSAKALSPFRLGELFARSFGASGYQKLPGGLIIQWGVTGSSASQTNIDVTFPIAFPGFCLAVIPAVVNASAGQDTFPVLIGSPSASGCTLNRGYASGTDASGVMRWIAVGY